VALSYPDPDLGDDVVRLRRWDHGDLECVREASTDSRIPQGTTVPAVFTADAGLEFIERQWSRVETGEGISLAMAEAGTDEARGLAVLLKRPQSDVVGIGFWVVPLARGRGLGNPCSQLALTLGARRGGCRSRRGLGRA